MHVVRALLQKNNRSKRDLEALFGSNYVNVFVLQGALFFDSLLQKLQTTYQFRLEDYMDGVAVRARPLRKTVK